MSDEQLARDEQLYKRRKLHVMIGSNVHAVSMGIDYDNNRPIIELSWVCPKCGARMEHKFGIFDYDCEDEMESEQS